MVRLTFLVLLLSSQLFAQVAIISDLDDTIKQTNVANTSRAAYNAMFTQKIFSGMDSLFSNMESYADLYILSASPDFFRYNIKRLVRKNGLNPMGIYTRGVRDLMDKERYKNQTIQLVAQKGYDGVILIGDDVEADPKIYTQYKADNPGKVLSIYIHKVIGAQLPEGVVAYYTAYGIALREVAAGRLTVSEARSVGEDLLSKDLGKAFPVFTLCPKTVEEIGMVAVEGLEDLTERVGLAIANYCRQRL